MKKIIVITIICLLILGGIFFIFKAKQINKNTIVKGKIEKSECPNGVRIECLRENGKKGRKVCENGHWSDCQWAPECSIGDRMECLTKDGKKGFKNCQNDQWSEICYLANADECKIKKGNLYSICLLENGKLVYTDKKSFTPGEFVVINVNLRKAMEEAKIDFDPYKVCSFNNFEETDVYLPERYKIDTVFREKGSHCSDSLRLKNNYNTVNYGLVQPSGKIKLEIRVWPEDIDLSTSQKAKKNINQSKIIFNYETNIK